ncbi:Trehalose transport system permease protein SugB [Paenibacillus sp. P1XP2]|nr:Trehalose transport system permease protein SugB [Paenibacillus sp. P1XP2]
MKQWLGRSLKHKLSLLMIMTTLVPLFLMMKNIGLLDTYGALILPYTAFELPITVFLAIGFMASIPREIEEAP